MSGMPVRGCRKVDVGGLCAASGNCHGFRRFQCAGLQAFRLRDLAQQLPGPGGKCRVSLIGNKMMKSGTKFHLDNCLLTYRDLLAAVDRLLGRIQRRYSAQIACHRGCACGCRNLSIFPIEALSLASALDNLQERKAAAIRHRAATASFWDCPLLEAGACSLYAFRPLICRTHGFPLKTVYHQQVSIGHCRHNFRNISPIPDDAVIDLDRINGTLRDINTSAVSQMAGSLQFPDRLSIAGALLLTGF